MNVKELVRITQGRLLSGSAETDIACAKISTDSRTIEKGDLFIALKGPKFDGSSFIKEAFKKGAVGAVVTRRAYTVKDRDKIIIEAEDTTRALQAIARYHRLKFEIPVIAVTGSNGKTTTKEMIWSILSTRYNVLKNEGTNNNHLGVPQTLLNLNPSHDICVLEMGMNHKGEIALLCDMAKPTMAVITNIGPSHLEFLGDLKGVFESKKEVLASLDKNGTAILNGDDELLSQVKEERFDILRFGFKETNDFRADKILIEKKVLRFTLNDEEVYALNLLGVHNIYNALAAIAAASRFRVSYESMRRALEEYKPSRMRLNVRTINGIEIIDDAYNSNPSSMHCALEVLRNYPAKSRWIVSGDMLELGSLGNNFHKMLGGIIAGANVQGLVTLGELSKATLKQARLCGMDSRNLWHCADHDEIVRILKKVTRKGDVVLIKGSRAMRMEEVISKLKT